MKTPHGGAKDAGGQKEKDLYHRRTGLAGNHEDITTPAAMGNSDNSAGPLATNRYLDDLAARLASSAAAVPSRSGIIDFCLPLTRSPSTWTSTAAAGISSPAA